MTETWLHTHLSHFLFLDTQLTFPCLTWNWVRISILVNETWVIKSTFDVALNNIPSKDLIFHFLLLRSMRNHVLKWKVSGDPRVSAQELPRLHLTLRIDAFELWCWRRLLRVPWTAGRSNRAILKEIHPEYSLEGLYWSWSSNTLATWCEKLTHWKRPWCWERWRAGEEEGDRGWDGCMASLTQWIEFEQTRGDSKGQRSLACCSPWAWKQLDMT